MVLKGEIRKKLVQIIEDFKFRAVERNFFFPRPQIQDENSSRNHYLLSYL